MNFLEKMQSRYTVKKYNPQEEVNLEQLEELKKILNLSPSSINSQPWNFSFVTDQEIKKELAEVSFFNKDRVLDCNYLIVFRVFKNVVDFEVQNVGHGIPANIEYYNTFLKPLGDSHIKNWMAHQVYLSLGILLSACAQMGIDSTPMEGIIPGEYDKVLNNDRYETLLAVCIGKRAFDDGNQPHLNTKSRLQKEIVISQV